MRRALLIAVVAGLAACGGGSTMTGYVIVAAGGQPLQAAVGDALPLIVKETMSDGTTRPLPAGAAVAWSAPSTVTALSPDSDSPNPIPAFGAQPTAIWIDNPGRPDRHDDLEGVLFVLDPGTVPQRSISVSAMVSGIDPGGQVAAAVALASVPVGDANRGATLFGVNGANCARCHGASGHGSDLDPDAGTYLIRGLPYGFPAPGLNAEPGNVGSDPAWTAALLAMAARSDMDNEGVTLRLPMVDWLTTSIPGGLLSTQDFADIYAFLHTQTH